MLSRPYADPTSPLLFRSTAVTVPTSSPDYAGLASHPIAYSSTFRTASILLRLSGLPPTLTALPFMLLPGAAFMTAFDEVGQRSLTLMYNAWKAWCKRNCTQTGKSGFGRLFEQSGLHAHDALEQAFSVISEATTTESSSNSSTDTRDCCHVGDLYVSGTIMPGGVASDAQSTDAMPLMMPSMSINNPVSFANQLPTLRRNYTEGMGPAFLRPVQQSPEVATGPEQQAPSFVPQPAQVTSSPSMSPATESFSPDSNNEEQHFPTYLLQLDLLSSRVSPNS